MESKALTRQELATFNLWATYWNALVSLQKLYKEELEKKLPGVEIDTHIQSINGFFGSDGEVLNDYPQLEDLYFQILSNRISVRISVSYGCIDRCSLELVKDTTNNTYYSQKQKEEAVENGSAIEAIFSDDLLLVAADWLKEQQLNQYASENFESN